MDTLAHWAYGIHLGRIPLIAVIGFVTYGLMAVGVLLFVAKRWSRKLIRPAFKLHRRIGYTVLALATFHLLLGVSVYV